MSALLNVNLMLALNRSLLNTDYAHKCSADLGFYHFYIYLHVTFPRHYTDVRYLVNKGNVQFLQCKLGLCLSIST